ncbi:hypothetical protein [Halorarius litoreus]|uniref:hypothetical protein n=1 Tax=Halorarius litoreus TaxID=2962676 RepID=UPI0020CB809C|nr:hypothetical protein [Halorarius litoreus]
MTNTGDSTDAATDHRFGPRQRELLDGWAKTVSKAASGVAYDFTTPDPRETLLADFQTFRSSPSKEAFYSFWSTDGLQRTTVFGAYILNQWDGDVSDLASFLTTVREADTWDPEWADLIASESWLFEFFSRTTPELPVVDSQTQSLLRKFGLRVGGDFNSSLAGMEAFTEAYRAHVGHATASTDHEVSIRCEIDELFELILGWSNEDLAPRLLGRSKPVYEPLIGWEGTADDGGRIEFDTDLVDRALAEYAAGVAAGAYGEGDSDGEYDAYWCGNYEEAWTHQAAAAVSNALTSELDGTDLSPDDLERVIEVYDTGHGVISSPVIEYLLGGRGWATWGPFKDHTREHSETAALVLSRLFDHEWSYVTGRLDVFRWFYEDAENLSADGTLMRLATGLLMLAAPDDYVMYQYSRAKSFFADVCVSEFTVDTGFDTTQYHHINVAAAELRDRLQDHFDDRAIERRATMVDIQAIFYFWHENPL